MTQPQAGWYDDPWSSDHYRYWDGATWTSYASPKYAPSQNQPAGPPSQAVSEQYQGSGGPPYHGGPSGTGGPDGPGGQTPPPYTGYAQPGYQPTGARTPDGVPLSGWWRRVWARLLDQIIVFVLALPLSGYFWYRASGEIFDEFDRILAAQDAGATPVWSPSTDVTLLITGAALLSVLVAVVYELLLLRRYGATWGKKALGISVRRRDRDGRLDWGSVVSRVGVVQGLALLGLLPVLGFVASLAGLLNYLWPLWDAKKQAWHDKAAGTNVVRRHG